VRVFRLQDSESKAKVWLSNHGARILMIHLPTDSGQLINVHKYYRKHKRYQGSAKYCGAVIGPIANRTKNAILKIGDRTYQLQQNDGKHNLHSGSVGLHKHYWSFEQNDPERILFETSLRHLEDGLPGNRTFSVSYSLKNQILTVQYKMTTDQDTISNMTIHPYFNLAGRGGLDNHRFQINATQITAVDQALIPTGILEDVANTRFDFTEAKPLGPEIIDHNFVMTIQSEKPFVMAHAECQQTGIQMELEAKEPGLQFYTGLNNYFAMEPQGFPDSTSHPHFPSTLLKANEEYERQVNFIFKTGKDIG